jgi:hypothetical protein
MRIKTLMASAAVLAIMTGALQAAEPFAVLDGVQATPMSVVEMDAVHGKLISLEPTSPAPSSGALDAKFGGANENSCCGEGVFTFNVGDVRWFNSVDVEPDRTVTYLNGVGL